jgi:hypothetical protein
MKDELVPILSYPILSTEDGEGSFLSTDRLSSTTNQPHVMSDER